MKKYFLFFVFLLLIILFSFIQSQTYAQDQIKDAYLVTKVLSEGERVVAVVLEFNSEVDGRTVNKNIFRIEARVGNQVGNRTVLNAYVNSTGDLVQNVFLNRGKFLIIELNSKDPLASTTFTDFDARKTYRVKMEYKIESQGSIKSSDGKDIGPFTVVVQKERRLVVEDFIPSEYKDDELKVSFVYRLFIPKNISKNQKYPLVLFLHGGGERGNDNELQIIANRGAVVWAEPGHQAEHPCFVLAPQCPSDSSWAGLPGDPELFKPSKVLQGVVKLIKKLIGEYNIDPKRIYVTGMSMGGVGTFSVISAYPELFAAAIPICGQGDPKQASKIRNIPIWVFHAEDDPVVPVEGSRSMVRALVDVGGKVKYTEYPKGYMDSIGVFPHGSWVPTYENEEVIDWMFEQRKR